MRVLVCGDREWTHETTIRRRLQQLPRDATIVHGAARGVDRLAAVIARRLGWSAEQIEAFPAEWDRLGTSAGPRRNQAMLNSGIDLVLAFHNDLTQSKGTADMVRRAQAAGVPVEIIGQPAPGTVFAED